MATPLSSLLRAATRADDEPLNILTISSHERYESGLALTGDRYFAIGGPGVKAWDPTFAPVPSSYTILPSADVPRDLDIDLVLCHSRSDHFEALAAAARALNCPLLCLEHVLPRPRWGRGGFARIRARRGDLNVFISAHAREAWGYARDDDATVIEHGVDLVRFRPLPWVHRVPAALSVVNDWINRDEECGFRFWREATGGLPVRVLGDTPGLSEPAASLDDLAWQYQTSLLFVNTALSSPVPTVLLEAMASGCCVISTRNPMLETILAHGVNGYLADDPAAMRGEILRALADPERALAIGAAGRRTIEDRFALGRFVTDWKAAFARVAPR